jgi:hypothetical protein
VRRVRLAAPRPELVRRGALLLEDALHTASLPGADGGRLLLVRRLDVGRIHPGRAPSALALALEERFRQLGAIAVHGGEPSAAHAPAVFFRDAVEAHAALAVRLASGAPVDGWYWRAAVPRWRADLGSAEGLRTVLASAAETPAGAFAPVAVLAALVERGVARPLLDALRWQDGPALLRACGWAPPTVPARLVLPSTTADDVLPAAWRPLVHDRVRAWGGDDARTVWLAAAALAADVPARMLDARLPARAQRAIVSITLPVAPPSHPEPGASVDGSRATSAPPPAPASATREMQPILIDPSPEVDRDGVSVDAGARTQAPPQPSAARGDSIGSRPPRRPDAPAIAPSPVPPAPDAPPSDPRMEEARAEPAPATRAERFGDVPCPTLGAGLPFLVPVLTRLGIGGTMAEHPWMADGRLPARVLRSVALRCGVLADDPMLAAFGADELWGEPSAEGWSAPAVWTKGIAAQGPRILRRTADGGTALFDASGRLPLAWWRGEVPIGAEPLLAKVVKVVKKETRGGFALLVDAWTVAARRWCRRGARMGMRTLVRRPGRVLATRTHVDVVFDHADADVRVRRAGLDLDPGWVPWLGRVVQFHYLYGERA